MKRQSSGSSRRHRACAVLAILLGGSGGGLVAAVATSAMGGSAAPAGASAKAPTCTTVSPATVKAALGGSPQAPNSNTSTNSFYGFKETSLTCSYSATAFISFSTPATTKDFKSLYTVLQHVARASTVAGLGNGAFTGTGSNTISSCPATGGTCKQKTVVTHNIWVLVTGTTIFEISASNVSFSAEEHLAKEIVRLV